VLLEISIAIIGTLYQFYANLDLSVYTSSTCLIPAKNQPWNPKGSLLGEDRKIIFLGKNSTQCEYHWYQDKGSYRQRSIGSVEKPITKRPLITKHTFWTLPTLWPYWNKTGMFKSGHETNTLKNVTWLDLLGYLSHVDKNQFFLGWIFTKWWKFRVIYYFFIKLN
jgi:hypothetical protein